MSIVIKSLLADKEEHKKKIGAIDETIKHMQEVCTHVFAYEGHDSHYNYETCKLCGLKRVC
ncbi:MAG: hypothetical protein KF721_09855 [Ignavibacteriaceae bacterium]|nr:hypothetical protein [Ignavibacteriaceae bacterium]